jgi:hypothetical protein
VSEAETAVEDEADDATAAAAGATGDARRQAAAGVAVFMDKSVSVDGDILPSSTGGGYCAAPAGPTCNYPGCTFEHLPSAPRLRLRVPHHHACYLEHRPLDGGASVLASWAEDNATSTSSCGSWCWGCASRPRGA